MHSAAEVPGPRPVLPKLAVIGMVSMAGLSIAAAAAGRWNPAPALQHGPAAISRDLLFEDGADGSVVVRLAGDAQPVEVLRGEQGFLRGTMRGLARTRKAEGIGAEAPFRLTAWADGKLTLEDPATARLVELSAFGPMNTTVFARLLTADRAR